MGDPQGADAPSDRPSKETEARPRVLVLTSTFPRYQGDPDPDFVFELSCRLSASLDIAVLAPHAPGCATSERMNGLSVHRFRYAPVALEALAYDGGILSRIKARPWRLFLVPLFLIGEYLALRRLLAREHYDLIHAHWVIPQGLVAALCVRGAKRRPRLLVTLHGADLFFLSGWWARYLKRFAMRRAAAISVVSTAMRAQVERLGVAADKLRRIPMGTDLDKAFVPASAPREAARVLFVGRLVEKKGVADLLEAFAWVRSSSPEAVLDIVGDGPLRGDLVRRSESLGIASGVQFRGALPHAELPRLFQRASMAVFPFRVTPRGDQEGFGLVLVEALGCACPVVCCEVPAVRDIVRHQETALLVPQRDPAALAQAISLLLADRSHADLLGAAGRAYVERRFSWQRSAADYLGLIKASLD